MPQTISQTVTIMPDPHNTTVLYISITTVSLSDFSREDSEHIMIVLYEQPVVYTQNTTCMYTIRYHKTESPAGKVK